MTVATGPAEALREPALHPVDRISEMIFGLLMALSFVGSMSVAGSGRTEVRELFVAALGCNLAWGLVDAVMYLVRTVTERGRSLTLVNTVRAAPDAASGRAIVEQSLSKVAANLVSSPEVEAVRGRILALPSVPRKPSLSWDDVLAALAVFVFVVLATFPVVLPFAFMQDVALAKNTSHAIGVAMLFVGGLGLGRYAGYGTWRSGFMMAGLGAVLVVAINLLGG